MMRVYKELSHLGLWHYHGVPLVLRQHCVFQPTSQNLFVVEERIEFCDLPPVRNGVALHHGGNFGGVVQALYNAKPSHQSCL